MDVRTKLAPTPAGGSATDARNQVTPLSDVNDELYLGTLRKREPIGAGNFAKNEQPRYNVQKAKDPVKRQRPKGQHHGGAEKNSKVVENKLPECDSGLVQGRKTNGNYLLNFHHYARNKTRDAQSRDVGRHSCNNDRLLPPVQRHKYNKEQFIQASCQFVVTANGDYSSYLTNADMLVDWKLIEQIKLHNSENLSCPICLDAPVAGKMTRCGHVYCWPCILRYLRYCQETGNYKCPICDEYLHKNDLKSVIEITRHTYNLGDTVSLRLMRREKNSLFATPVEPMIHPPTTFLSVSNNATNQIYSKLLIASAKDIMDIIERERSELELERRNNPDMTFDIEQALNELLKREEKLKDAESKDTLSVENIKKDTTEETPQGHEINANTCCKEDTTSLVKQSSTDSVSSDSQSVSNSTSKFLYFYQAEDGQHMYLGRLNVSMLKEQYGSLEFCPPVITGKLLEKQASICTELLRQNLRYLCHLPLTCLFESVEIELKPPLVSEEVLCNFHVELNLRQKNRKEKEREEKKREKRIIEVENKLIGIYPMPNIDIESHQHFPQLQAELQLSNEHVLSLSESATSSIASSPPLSAFDEIPKQETDHPSHGQTRTFADITKKLPSTMPIKTYNKSTNAWPSVKSRKPTREGTTSSNKDEEEASPKLVTKTHDKPANAWSVKSKTYSATGTSSSNEDERKPDVSEQAKDDGGVAGKKKKKKKNKGTVLLTTGMTSGYSL